MADSKSFIDSLITQIHVAVEARSVSNPMVARVMRFFFTEKQDTLVSGENIKTVDGMSLVGPGDINIQKTFYAHKGTTSYTSIMKAYDSGVTIYCIVSGIAWPILSVESNRINFVSPEGTSQTYVRSNNVWGGISQRSIDTTPTQGSSKVVTSGGVYNAIASLFDAIETISQFKPIPVSVLPTPSAETMNKLYVTPKTNGFTGDTKDEWYTIESPRTADYECYATKEEMGIILLSGGEFIALDSTSPSSLGPCIAEYTGSGGTMEVETAEERGLFTVIFPLEEGMTFESIMTGKQYIVDSEGLFVETELKDYLWEKVGDRYGVSYKPQTLTPAQKAQARQNIGAAETAGEIPYGTQDVAGIVRLHGRPISGVRTNKSGLIFADNEGSLAVNCPDSLAGAQTAGVYRDGSGQLKTVISHSATPAEIQQIGQQGAPDAAAITIANFANAFKAAASDYYTKEESDAITSLCVTRADYNSSTKRIRFYNGSTWLFNIDATPFIVDGMVDTVSITGGNLVITFNTDSGKQPISIPLTDIFNPTNYYTKLEIDDITGSIKTFIATYGTTTKTEIDGAIAANRVILVPYQDRVYRYVGKISGSYLFSAVTGSTIYYLTMAGSTGSWISSSQQFQAKLTSGTTIKTINGVSILGYGNITIKEPFMATYGTTTYQSVSEAFSNGRFCYAKDSNANILPIVRITNTTITFQAMIGREVYIWELDDNDSWTEQIISL